MRYPVHTIQSRRYIFKYEVGGPDIIRFNVSSSVPFSEPSNNIVGGRGGAKAPSALPLTTALWFVGVLVQQITRINIE